MKVIVNSTPLIVLAEIDKLNLFKDIYGSISVAQAVYDEVVNKGQGRQDAWKIKKCRWINVNNVNDDNYVNFIMDEFKLDLGEAETISLARKEYANLVFIDEKKGRKVAELFKIEVRGTVGLIIHAKKLGLVKNVTAILNSLRGVDFRLSDTIYQRVKHLENNGEL